MPMPQLSVSLLLYWEMNAPKNSFIWIKWNPPVSIDKGFDALISISIDVTQSTKIITVQFVEHGDGGSGVGGDKDSKQE